MKEKICTTVDAFKTVVKNKDYTTRELVLAAIIVFLTGILLGMKVSPKKHTVVGSNNGNNNVGGNVLRDKNDDEDEEIEE